MSTPDPIGASREGDTLDSWKDIAAYLRRSVRAAQMWEREEGLPVHRHLHEKRGSVYAYKSEIDEWLERRRAASAMPETEVRPARSRGLAGALAGAIVVALALWWINRDTPDSLAVALPFNQKDSVLISALENHTGERLFDGSVEYFLERELAESEFVEVVSRERVADALRLMKRTAETPVDRALAREVALRDGAIRAIASARLQKLGGTYLLGVDLLHPGSGQRAAAFTEEAENHDQIALAARKLAVRLRRALGERTAGNEGETDPLERVTSPSLRAVQLFTQADRLVAFRNNAAAERLLLQAIEEDPNFASAHMHLAFAKRNQRKPPEDYLPHAERAVKLAATTSNRERYFILGSHALMTGKREEALAHYKALLQLEPGHFWATNNIGNILKFEMGRAGEAVPYRVRTAELRPNEFASNYAAAESLANWAGKPEDARPYFRRAVELITPEDEKMMPEVVVWARLNAAQEAWLNGDRDAVIRQLDTWRQAARSSGGPSADLLLGSIGYFELAIGREQNAEEIVGLIRHPEARERYAAHLAYALGAREKARAGFQRLLARRDELTDLDLLRSVQSGAGGAVARDLERFQLHPSSRQIIRAEIALTRGDRGRAIDLYRDALGRYRDPGGRALPLYLAAAESLAKALEAEGKPGEAIALLEELRQYRRRVPPEGLPQWMALQRLFDRLSGRAGNPNARSTRG